MNFKDWKDCFLEIICHILGMSRISRFTIIETGVIRINYTAAYVLHKLS